MTEWLRDKAEEIKGPRGKANVYLVLFLLGLTLSLVHMDWLGKTWGFGIIVGYGLLLTGSIGLLISRWKSISLGTMWIAVPIILLIASAAIQTGSGSTLYVVQILILVLVFLVARIIGSSVFFLVIPLGLVLTVLSILEGPSGYPEFVGGMGFTGNPNLTGSYLALSILFLEGKWKWLAPLILVGIFFTGDHWAVIGLTVVGLVMLVRRDWIFSSGWKVTVATLVVPLVVVGLFWNVGIAQKLYGFDLKDGQLVAAGLIVKEVTLDFNDRGRVALEVLDDLSLIGHGVQSDTSNVDVNRYGGLVHNAPLMILDDLGLVASTSWIVLVLFCIVKSKRYRYQFILILVSSMFVYWYWVPTGLGPYFWSLLGGVSKEVDLLG